MKSKLQPTKKTQTSYREPRFVLARAHARGSCLFVDMDANFTESEPRPNAGACVITEHCGLAEMAPSF